MHPFIHKSTDGANPINSCRPQHDYTYIAITDVHAHATRYSKGRIFSPNTNKYSKTKQPIHTTAHFTELHSTVWNALPQQLKNTTSLAVFKRQLKEHLLIEQERTYTLESAQGHHLA